MFNHVSENIVFKLAKSLEDLDTNKFRLQLLGCRVLVYDNLFIQISKIIHFFHKQFHNFWPYNNLKLV